MRDARPSLGRMMAYPLPPGKGRYPDQLLRERPSPSRVAAETILEKSRQLRNEREGGMISLTKFVTLFRIAGGVQSNPVRRSVRRLLPMRQVMEPDKPAPTMPPSICPQVRPNLQNCRHAGESGCHPGSCASRSTSRWPEEPAITRAHPPETIQPLPPLSERFSRRRRQRIAKPTKISSEKSP